MVFYPPLEGEIADRRSIRMLSGLISDDSLPDLKTTSRYLELFASKGLDIKPFSFFN